MLNSTPLFPGLFSVRKQDPTDRNDGNQLEYLFEDEYKTPGPTWSARVCYGVGTTYLSGLTLGGLWGAIEAARNRPGFDTTRLRVNHLLNTMTARGPFLGNNAAVLALMYNGLHGAIIATMDGQHGAGTATAAAALTGALFRVRHGWRAAGRGAGILGGAMLLYTCLFDYVRHGHIYIH